VWCKKEEKLSPSNIRKIKKFGGGSLMIWGCITPRGVGEILRIDTNIDSTQYCNILYDGFIKTCDKFNYNLTDVSLMQDNATCHVSKKTKKWLSINNINAPIWPSNSPDLNIIENVWALLKRKIRRSSIRFLTKDQLWNFIEAEWYKIPKEYIKKLYFSMCNRVKSLIEAKGLATKY
jgi:hypothetical protein